MLVKLALIICIVFALNEVDALAFHENIEVNGGGQLMCRTDTPVVKDWLDSNGTQIYSRAVNIDMENETASLITSYELNNISKMHKKSKKALKKPSSDTNHSSAVAENATIRYDATGKDLSNGTLQIGSPMANGSTNYQEGLPPNSNNPLIVALQGRDVLPQTPYQMDKYKNNSSIARYNRLPVYSRSFRVKRSSTKEFDLLYYNSEGVSQNRYGIKMTNPNQLEHGVAVSRVDNFTANNAISFKGGQVITNYHMKGAGFLKGSVIESGTMGRPHHVAETWIDDTYFIIDSGVENDAKIVMKSDSEAMSDKLDKTKVNSTKPKESTKSELYRTLEYRQKDPNNISYDMNSESNQVATGIVNPLKDPLANDGGVGNNASTISTNNATEGNRSQEKPSNPIASKDASNKKGTKEVGDLKKPSITVSSAKASFKGTIIPGSVFGSSINSPFSSSDITMISAAPWGAAYIGLYSPIQNTGWENISGSGYKYRVSNGRLEYENETENGTKQKYLNIRAKGERIKVRSTPPNVDFDIYRARVDV